MELVNFTEDEHLKTLNHSCAHLMAQAVRHIWPDAKFWVGPVVEEGFYYDMDLGDHTITDEDLDKITKEMKKCAKSDKRIVRQEISREEALARFKDDPYKVDLITRMPEGTNISMYTQGDFTDLCRGPHVESTKKCRYFKLMKHSGAYWKGDVNNKMLQRIYGVCFDTKEDLDKYLEALEEAKKRDHKKIGREMGLFMMSEFAPGMPFFLPDGMILQRQLEEYWHEEHVKEGYQFVRTPIMMSKELWETSGHWGHYKQNMYTSKVENREFAIKPMNCPGAVLVYNNSLHSYKDLPLRLAEEGLVHRNEASGALNGLFRVREFTQDDSHIFVTVDQIEDEVGRIIALIDRIYSVLGLTYNIELSTRPESYIGELDVWEKSEKALAEACRKAGKDFVVNPGDGAFYGPKLDFHIKDSLGRIWQCGTVQLDMNLPGRFGAVYVDKDGSRKTPIMLHRVVFGSFERFIGILTEHFAGHFPLWMAPHQLVVIPVHQEKHLVYAKQVQEALQAKGLRVDLDDRNEKLGYRVREAQIKHINYQLVVGDGEMAENTVTIRKSGSRKSETVSLEDAIQRFVSEVDTKELFKAE
ncbi:threonine--tRNA ligase [Absicoccus intestinalis]|uniref:Threonine--tRNA ligase n=1 Tax=Absicoccus intestinalis TaxID=2926319 RepID=A0ABU4WJX3_9FIRM|nr:threonine--tRNA ligase [Absicoccus sp. CLA-KB-P134]MDX8416866.1 threonine--tRNA ligase [Absicoccus sp. CLA-KB-P134]